MSGLWQPESSIGWIDVDRAEAQRVKELLGLFRAPEALDPHGILPLQITLSDRLFPGMSTQHTRARYVFFAGWHAERLAAYRGKQSPMNYLRQDEIHVMKSLLQGDDTTGIFGKRKREKTQTLPSGIYWSALQRWGIVPPDLPLWEVHQAASAGRTATSRYQRSDDDAVATGGHSARLVLPDFPPIPPGFPSGVDITMTHDEAEYLRDRVAASCKDTFLPTVLNHRPDAHGEALATGELPWSIDPEAGGHALVDARRFSELIHPARLMYTKLLVEDARERGHQLDDISADLDSSIASWRAEVDPDVAELRGWADTRLGALLHDPDVRLSGPRRHFIKSVVELTAADPHGCWDDPELGRQVRCVERAVKKKHARLQPGAPFDRWLKRPTKIASNRLDYRWGNVQRFVDDLEGAA